MKITNVDPPGDRALGSARGRNSTIKATSRGVRIIDRSGRDVEPVTTLRVPWVQELDDDEAELGSEVGQPFTNDSGGTLAVGTVVVIDGTNVILTTTAQDTRPVGVVIVAGDDGNDVVVQTAGKVDLVNVTAAVTANNFAETSTTAGAATESATRRTGSFAVFLTSGTAPSALLFGAPDSSPAIVSGDYVLTYNGGEERIQAHGSAGASETIDLADGNWHRVTLDADCTFSFTGATNGKGCSFTLFLTEDGTGGWDPTWPGSVAWIGGVTPTHDTTAGSVAVYGFMSYDGGTNWLGFQAGGGSGGAATTRWELAVVPGSPPESLYADGDWLYIEVPI